MRRKNGSKEKSSFNEKGDIELSKRRMINGNTTNLNDFNNMKYSWVSDWYRLAMNNFWIPEEINLTQDIKDYRKLDATEKTAYDKILSFSCIFRFTTINKFAKPFRIYNGKRSKFMSEYSNLSRSYPFTKLWIYFRYNMLSGRENRNIIPMER